MEAVLEPRLVMKGDDDIPFVSGDFFVASYQRGFRWGEEQVTQLLNDIRANAKEADSRGEKPADYFLQPIVVLRKDEDTWELIDGQQRLTTLFLITKYVATKLADSRVQYSISYETRDREGRSSREFLESVGSPEAESLRIDNIDYFHIAQAYDAISDWFESHNNSRQAAIDIYTALSKWVYVIWYQAPAGTNPNELFTRLNRDRIPLTDSELIKALVLSQSGSSDGDTSRRHEIAAQWDGFERDLRNSQFWAFLTGSAQAQPTHIEFLFKSMVTEQNDKSRWVFDEVWKLIQNLGATRFWSDVVERHGLLTGWFNDRNLYHRIGYLVATGDSIQVLIEASRAQTHSAFRESLRSRIRNRLNLTRNDASLLRYGNSRDYKKCSDVLLLMNVETVLKSSDNGSRFDFHSFASQGWSLEHIHAQSSQALATERERRDWILAHQKKIEDTDWETTGKRHLATEVLTQMAQHLSMPENKTNEASFQKILDGVFPLFSVPEPEDSAEEMHGLGNLALLQRDFNSKLNNAVFLLKRERILELDAAGEFILPCTRNVFLKYYTSTGEQQLSLWGPGDRDSYYEQILKTIEDFLSKDPEPQLEKIESLPEEEAA